MGALRQSLWIEHCDAILAYGLKENPNKMENNTFLTISYEMFNGALGSLGPKAIVNLCPIVSPPLVVSVNGQNDCSAAQCSLALEESVGCRGRPSEGINNQSYVAFCADPAEFTHAFLKFAIKKWIYLILPFITPTEATIPPLLGVHVPWFWLPTWAEGEMYLISHKTQH